MQQRRYLFRLFFTLAPPRQGRRSTFLVGALLILTATNITTMANSMSTATRAATNIHSTSLSLSTIRGVFVGSGSDGMSDPRIVQVISDLAFARDGASLKAPSPSQKRVLYLGTATYDLPQFAQKQTQHFTTGENKGLFSVDTLDLVHQTPSSRVIQDTISQADIIVVGGGNTLYAVDRWKTLQCVIPALEVARERGAILTGGSAGAICWFDGGHSDSMDPDTYLRPMMAKYGGSTSNDRGTPPASMAEVGNESSSSPNSGDTSNKGWKYIRVPGIGFLPGLVCPHHDRIQSNGVLRAHDFDTMMLRQHPGEIGIGIDHWAALVVDGIKDFYRVISLDDKPGSVLKDEEGKIFFSEEALGVPGIWIKHVHDGQVVSRLLPASGKLSDVLRSPSGTFCEDESALAQCRKDNPDSMLSTTVWNQSP